MATTVKGTDMNTATGKKLAADALVSEQVVNAALDDGFAESKLVTEDADGNLVMLKIASTARGGAHGVSAVGAAGATVAAAAYETDGERFTVGEFIEGENARFNDYPFSAMNRVIVNHLLRVGGLSGKKIRLATSLPIGTYFHGGVVNSDVIMRKQESLRKPVTVFGSGKMPIIDSQAVMCECVSAWVDQVVGEDGSLNLFKKPVAFIDIGGRTTDVAVILPDMNVDHSCSGTEDVGVLDLYKFIKPKLQDRLKLNDVPLALMQQAVKENKVDLWGESHDVADIVAEGVADISKRIVRVARRLFGDGATLERVVIVGGGACVFGDALLEEFGRIGKVAEFPEFANARGMFKFMKYAI